MTNIGLEGEKISSDIYVRLTSIQENIEKRKGIIFKKYLPILGHLKIHDKNISKVHLIELRKYLGSELAKMTRTNLKQIGDTITHGFGLDSSDISQGIAFITSRITKKAEGLMNMESIRNSDSTGTSSFDLLDIEEIEIPHFLSKGGLRFPMDHKWTDLHDLIELVGLLIVQKELIAERIILDNQAVISGRQASVLAGK